MGAIRPGRERLYDAIIIGSGQAGNPLASALADAGWRSALVERAHLGGSCINYGCTPTKTMVASARVAWLARRARDFGVRTGPVEVDLASVRRRQQQMVRKFREGKEKSFASTQNLDVVRGEARFVAPLTVEVVTGEDAPQVLKAPKIFINVGCRPRPAEIPGIEGVSPLDSTSILKLGKLPRNLVVLGGGYVGLEFAQMFRRFGSRVTIVQRAPHLLDKEDEDVSEAIAEILEEDGVRVLVDTEAKRVRESAKGFSLEIVTANKVSRIMGDQLLVAVGRIPNGDSLGLAAAGVRTDERGFIVVNDRLETTAEGVYALGDVKGGPAFTHISYDDYRVLEKNLLEGGKASTRGRLVAYTVFTDPELGRIGMNETEARKSGRRIRVAKLPMSSVARALESNETRGFIKAVVDAESERILGAAVLGVVGGEIMGALQIAMMGDLSYPALRDGVFAHPTLMEGLNTLFTSFEDD